MTDLVWNKQYDILRARGDGGDYEVTPGHTLTHAQFVGDARKNGKPRLLWSAYYLTPHAALDACQAHCDGLAQADMMEAAE